MIHPLSRRFLTVTTDLSLILFLVCASALQEEAPTLPAPEPHEAPVMLGVWSHAPGGPSLAAWLAEQPADDSQRLSLEISYRAGGAAEAFARADALRRSAGAAGEDALVLIAEGPAYGALAQLVQDNSAIGPDVAQHQ